MSTREKMNEVFMEKYAGNWSVALQAHVRSGLILKEPELVKRMEAIKEAKGVNASSLKALGAAVLNQGGEATTIATEDSTVIIETTRTLGRKPVKLSDAESILRAKNVSDAQIASIIGLLYPETARYKTRVTVLPKASMTNLS
jgi:hypothetical protein